MRLEHPNIYDLIHKMIVD